MSKKRFIWQRRLGAGLSVLLCLSMLPVAALAEEPDGSEDALRNTAVEKVDTEIIENTTDNDAVVEDAIVENAVITEKTGLLGVLFSLSKKVTNRWPFSRKGGENMVE